MALAIDGRHGARGVHEMRRHLAGEVDVRPSTAGVLAGSGGATGRVGGASTGAARGRGNLRGGGGGGGGGGGIGTAMKLLVVGKSAEGVEILIAPELEEVDGAEMTGVVEAAAISARPT